MEPAELVVTKWDSNGDETESCFVRHTDGRWIAAGDDLGTSFILEQMVSVGPGEAIWIETSGSIVAADVAAALPRNPDHVGYQPDLYTGDDYIDRYVDIGGTPVVIDGERWAAFPLFDGGTQTVGWYPCDRDELDCERGVPVTRRRLAQASVIELASRTGGTSRWWVDEVDDDTVCFTDDLDEEPTDRYLETRAGRSDREIIEMFMRVVDIPPVAMAIARALQTGGDFHGRASELSPEFAETCEVSVEIYIN